MPNVLLIDGESDVAAIAEIALRAAGYASMVAGSFGEALASLETQAPAAVVFSVAPYDDGPGRCQSVLRAWPGAKAVALTSDTHGCAVLTAAGAHGCLVEPFDFDDLVREVTRLVGPP